MSYCHGCKANKQVIILVLKNSKGFLGIYMRKQGLRRVTHLVLPLNVGRISKETTKQVILLSKCMNGGRIMKNAWKISCGSDDDYIVRVLVFHFFTPIFQINNALYSCFFKLFVRRITFLEPQNFLTRSQAKQITKKDAVGTQTQDL